jgi:PIN domain nuclease of toxin-antitoxin system
VILLDTNAVIWVDRGHPRTRALTRGSPRLFISPATLLELQFLHEANRIRLRRDALDSIVYDDRWTLDEPSSVEWFVGATALSWTRDPFDRLIVAHAQLRRWRLATADEPLLERLGPSRSIAL